MTNKDANARFLPNSRPVLAGNVAPGSDDQRRFGQQAGAGRRCAAGLYH